MGKVPLGMAGAPVFTARMAQAARLASSRNSSAMGAAVPVFNNSFFTQQPLEKSDMVRMYEADEPEYQ